MLSRAKRHAEVGMLLGLRGGGLSGGVLFLVPRLPFPLTFNARHQGVAIGFLVGLARCKCAVRLEGLEESVHAKCHSCVLTCPRS